MNTVIEHLVVAGGGTYGFQAYGTLQELKNQQIWDPKQLKTCHGTSIGSVLLLMFLLDYDEEELTNYFVKRPWHKLLEYNIATIFSSIQENGLFTINTFKHIVIPLLKGMDCDEHMTLQEFYEKTQVEFHIYATQLEDFKAADISYKTHGSWTLIEAIYASCCIPILFKPFEKDGFHYIDGGTFLNYPLEPCLKNCEAKNVLGIRKIYENPENVTHSTNLLDYMGILLNKTTFFIDQSSCQDLTYEVQIKSPPLSISDFFEFAQSQTMRQDWVNKGYDIARNMIKEWNKEPSLEENDEITLEDDIKGTCSSCGIPLDRYRDGTIEDGHRCNDCYQTETGDI